MKLAGKGPATSSAKSTFSATFEFLVNAAPPARVLDGDSAQWPGALLEQIADVASRRYSPQLFAQGAVDFQFTRGLVGISV